MSHYEKLDDNSDLFLLGEQLREVREAQGLSYDDVAKSTHVRPHILKDIEEGRLDGIAAPIYVRGFIKTYCEFLMAQDLWKKYSALLVSAEPPISSDESVDFPVDISHPRPIFRRKSIVWVYIVLVTAVLGSAFLLWNQYKNPDKTSGFFLRFSPPQTEQPAQPAQTSIQGTVPPEKTPGLIAAVSDETQSVVVLAPPVLAEQTPVSGAPQETAVSADLSWLDGGEAANAGHEITVPQSLIPDQRLLIEVTAPVRLIVQREGIVVTRRNLTAGGVRSYDVTVSTPVSLSSGSAADVTWYGKRYAPIGSDNTPLRLTFNPDGTVLVLEGSSPHFSGGSPNALGN